MDIEYFVVPASFGIVPGGEIIGVQEANAIFWRHLKFIHMLDIKKEKNVPTYKPLFIHSQCFSSFPLMQFPQLRPEAFSAAAALGLDHECMLAD